MTVSGYRSVRLRGGRVLVKPSILKSLGNVDAVVFDCDGVLVDTRGSYDATIVKVTSTMVSKFARVRLPYKAMLPDLILKLRRTGGFNNDWDTTYAMTLFSILSLDETKVRMIGKASVSNYSARYSQPKTEVRANVNRLRNIVEQFCSSSGGLGYAAVNHFLENRKKLSRPFKAAVKHVRDFLGYPGSPPDSFMATLFDETYCGPELFKKMYGFPAHYYLGEGMIERERVLISREILEKLKGILGGKKIAMSTGRPFVATKYSLRHLMTYFDRRASTYIGDADVYTELAAAYEKYRKPRGESLIRAMDEFATDGMLYVGDSAEDQMMVEDAKRKHDGILFAAVSGTGANEDEQIRYFTRRGADLVMRSVNQVPLVLEALRR
ncbi:MAG: hypothetical protein HYW93_00535 [Thaumarchaeota archaeon]|nr:hypothetical protein [Nitrososphaerota archaeon]